MLQRGTNNNSSPINDSINDAIIKFTRLCEVVTLRGILDQKINKMELQAALSISDQRIHLLKQMVVSLQIQFMSITTGC